MIKFLLLLGVSGVGKSTLIRELIGLDSRFTYISPYTTRELRDGEADKIHVTKDQLEAMIERGEILTVNELYGIRYATPRKPIDDAFLKGHFPLLDWPIKKLEVMERAFPHRLCRVYLEPPSITELQRRLGNDNRDANGKRLLAAISELEEVSGGFLDGHFDIRIKNVDGQALMVAKQIYRHYHSAIH